MDHALDLCARAQQQGDIVEAALHVECRSQRPASHPEHSEARVVGNHLTRADGIDVFRRQPHANDLKFAPPPVENGTHRVPGVQSVGVHETLRYDHLVGAPRFDVAAPHQHDVVYDLALALGNGHQPARRRFGKPFHVQGHIDHNSRFGLCHARDRRDAVSKY